MGESAESGAEQGRLRVTRLFLGLGFYAEKPVEGKWGVQV